MGSLGVLCLSEVTVHSAAYRTVPVLVEGGLKGKEKKIKKDQTRSGRRREVFKLGRGERGQRKGRSKEVVKRRKRRGHRLS